LVGFAPYLTVGDQCIVVKHDTNRKDYKRTRNYNIREGQQLEKGKQERKYKTVIQRFNGEMGETYQSQSGT